MHRAPMESGPIIGSEEWWRGVAAAPLPRMTSDCFPADFAAARRGFAAAAKAANAALSSFRHPACGPDGAALFTDVARLGPDDADALLVLISGTHGVEGLCGSGVQVAWLADAAAGTLPPRVAALLVHAINPYGFAWCRRVDHENIDVNRNWIDFAVPPPSNPAYDALRTAICPAGAAPDWDAADHVLQRHARDHGARALQAAVSGGQWSDADGVFYGGSAPSWSRQTLAGILERHARGVRRVALLDIHTGIGAYGRCEAIVPFAPDDPVARRALRWFGLGMTTPGAADSASAPVRGDAVSGAAALLDGAEVTVLGLEFGVGPLAAMLDAVRHDAWLHRWGDPLSPQGRAIKRRLRAAFFSEDSVWQGMVLGQSLALCRQALLGLAAT